MATYPRVGLPSSLVTIHTHAMTSGGHISHCASLPCHTSLCWLVSCYQSTVRASCHPLLKVRGFAEMNDFASTTKLPSTAAHSHVKFHFSIGKTLPTIYGTTPHWSNHRTLSTAPFPAVNSPMEPCSAKGLSWSLTN